MHSCLARNAVAWLFLSPPLCPLLCSALQPAAAGSCRTKDRGAVAKATRQAEPDSLRCRNRQTGNELSCSLDCSRQQWVKGCLGFQFHVLCMQCMQLVSCAVVPRPPPGIVGSALTFISSLFFARGGVVPPLALLLLHTILATCSLDWTAGRCSVCGHHRHPRKPADDVL